MISLQEFKTVIAVAATSTLLCLTSCDKSKDCCAVIDMHFDLDVRTKSNNSVFDPSVKGHLTQDSIQIFYLRDGKYELVHNTGYDAANGFLFFKPTDQSSQYIIRIMVSSFTDSKNESWTLIKYGSLKTDTIKSATTNSVIQKIWFNETEVSLTGKPYTRILK